MAVRLIAPVGGSEQATVSACIACSGTTMSAKNELSSAELHSTCAAAMTLVVLAMVAVGVVVVVGVGVAVRVVAEAL